MFSNPLPKQFTSHHRPFAHIYKVISHAGIIGNDYADALARKSKIITLTLWIPPPQPPLSYFYVTGKTRASMPTEHWCEMT
jgi:hypothetical protein